MPTNRSLKPARLLMLLALLLQGCASAPPNSLPVAIQASAPPLPSQARQLPAPAWCSPTCSDGLTTLRGSWLKPSTKPALEGSRASGSTMP